MEAKPGETPVKGRAIRTLSATLMLLAAGLAGGLVVWYATRNSVPGKPVDSGTGQNPAQVASTSTYIARTDSPAEPPTTSPKTAAPPTSAAAPPSAAPPTSSPAALAQTAPTTTGTDDGAEPIWKDWGAKTSNLLEQNAVKRVTELVQAAKAVRNLQMRMSFVADNQKRGEQMAKEMARDPEFDSIDWGQSALGQAFVVNLVQDYVLFPHKIERYRFTLMRDMALYGVKRDLLVIAISISYTEQDKSPFIDVGGVRRRLRAVVLVYGIDKETETIVFCTRVEDGDRFWGEIDKEPTKSSAPNDSKTDASTPNTDVPNGPHRLLEGGWKPAWSADSSGILFCRERGDGRSVYNTLGIYRSHMVARWQVSCI